MPRRPCLHRENGLPHASLVVYVKPRPVNGYLSDSYETFSSYLAYIAFNNIAFSKQASIVYTGDSIPHLIWGANINFNSHISYLECYMQYHKILILVAGIIPLLSVSETSEAKIFITGSVPADRFKQSTSSNRIKTDFEIFKECGDMFNSCILSPEPMVEISTPLSLDKQVSLDAEGLLTYQFTVEDMNSDATKIPISTIKIGDFARIRASKNYVPGGGEYKGKLYIDINTPGGFKTFEYPRTDRNQIFNIGLSVPIGAKSPASVKLIVTGVRRQRFIQETPIIHSIESDVQTLNNWVKNGRISFTRSDPSSYISIEDAYALYGEAPVKYKNPWGIWHSNSMLCSIEPYKDIYKKISKIDCGDHQWKDVKHEMVAGICLSDCKDHKLNFFNPNAIVHNFYFSHSNMLNSDDKEPARYIPKGNVIGGLSAHAICGIPIVDVFPPRDEIKRYIGDSGKDKCKDLIISIANLYFIRAGFSFSELNEIITSLIHGQHVESGDPDAVQELRNIVTQEEAGDELMREAVSISQGVFKDYALNNPSSTFANAQTANLTLTTCTVNKNTGEDDCAGDANSNSNVQWVEFPSGRQIIPDEVEFTPRGLNGWSQSSLDAAHDNLLARDYVFVGFHGTNHIAANEILNGIRHRPRSDGTPTAEEWGGLYVAADPSVAHGYALPPESMMSGRNRGAMLRVYIRKEYLNRFYRTNMPLNSEGIEAHISQILGPGRELPLVFESITGPEKEDGNDETLLGWGVAVRAVAIPSMIPGNTFNSEEMVYSQEEKNISGKPPYIQK